MQKAFIIHCQLQYVREHKIDFYFYIILKAEIEIKFLMFDMCPLCFSFGLLCDCVC